jgi:hypothetical protein
MKLSTPLVRLSTYLLFPLEPYIDFTRTRKPGRCVFVPSAMPVGGGYQCDSDRQTQIDRKIDSDSGTGSPGVDQPQDFSFDPIVLCLLEVKG